MNPRKKLSDYQQLGSEKNLELMQDTAPRRITESVGWRCCICNRVHMKSWVTLFYGKHGCRCQNGIQLEQSQYEEIAASLSSRFKLTIRYVPGDFIPQNTWQQVKWHIKEYDMTFEACYHELSYNGVSSRVQDIIQEAAHAYSK